MAVHTHHEHNCHTQPVQKGGLLRSPSRRLLRNRGGSCNPYASVKFCGQTQRTSEVYDSLDPLWPRGETMFMDVSLPLPLVTHGDADDHQEEEGMASASPVCIETEPETPSTKLTIALFHADHDKRPEKYPTKKELSGDSDEPFLGMSTLDLTPLLTGKIMTLDRWLPLTGVPQNYGKVRVVCEYEASDPPPRPGDTVRFSRFCHPEDLYPVPASRAYRVSEVDGDDVVLSYQTQEGWWCSFMAHRFMLVCEDRHQGAIDMCHEELVSVTERLSHSPMIKVVAESVSRVPDEGIVSIGIGAVQNGASLLERWWSGGIETAVGDITFATNWDGRFNAPALPSSSSVNPAIEASVATESSTTTTSALVATEELKKAPLSENENQDPLPGMPCCPITGLPMIDPVVAADGHTYERGAIARWFQTSDKSPMTGSFLPHKELVPNYVLLSSLQEAAKQQS